VRVPSTFPSDRAGSTNAELKASDSSSNPYLALGGLLAAGLDGVTRKLEPGEPVLVDPGALSENERRERGIERYPTTLRAALDLLERDAVLMPALGPTLARAYLAVKRSEAEAFGRENADFETKHHFWKF
jgi:glutamine synthetase